MDQSQHRFQMGHGNEMGSPDPTSSSNSCSRICLTNNRGSDHYRLVRLYNTHTSKITISVVCFFTELSSPKLFLREFIRMTNLNKYKTYTKQNKLTRELMWKLFSLRKSLGLESSVKKQTTLIVIFDVCVLTLISVCTGLCYLFHYDCISLLTAPAPAQQTNHCLVTLGLARTSYNQQSSTHCYSWKTQNIQII